MSARGDGLGIQCVYIVGDKSEFAWRGWCIWVLFADREPIEVSHRIRGKGECRVPRFKLAIILVWSDKFLRATKGSNVESEGCGDVSDVEDGVAVGGHRLVERLKRFTDSCSPFSVR